MIMDWLPPLLLLMDYNSDMHAYGDALYDCFKKDFLDSLPTWPDKRVGLKRLPLRRGKEATFWHFITTGDDEEARNIDLPRCERIRWPRPVMEAFTNKHPTKDDHVVWWKNSRKGEINYLIALPGFSFLFILRDRGDYVLPWTQYVLHFSHQRQKNRNEYEVYWKSKNS